MWIEIMQKLRNKIQEKKAELKLDNAELGLAIGRGERYIDRLLRDTVSTAKQEEVIGVLDGLSCSSIAARLQIQSYLAAKNANKVKDYQNQLQTSTKELSNLKDQYKLKNIQIDGLLKDAGECRESASRKIRDLESNLDQTGSALRFMKIMCIVLALICAVIISTSVFR